MRKVIDNAWFSRKTAELANGMYVLAVSILKNEADAEDAIQNALLLAYRNLDKLRMFDKFKPWLFKILTNECYKIINARKYSDDIENISLEAGESCLETETKMTLWETINSLPEDYRTVTVLFYYEDMKITEIASVLNVSEDTVKKRLSRAREKLRRLLDEEDFYE